MPLSDVDRQLGLVQVVGDVDPATGDPVMPTAQGITGIVFANISQLWLKYADKALISSQLRDIYVLRDSYDLVIGRLSALVDISLNNGQINLKLNQRVQIYRQQRAALQLELVRVETNLSRNSEPLIGAIAISSPISPPLPGERSSSWPYGPDGNDPRFSGSPYWPGRRRGPF